MTAIVSVEAATAGALQAAPLSSNAAATAVETTPSNAFAGMLSSAGAELEARIDHADELTRRFVVGDDIPAHEVIIALEQARLAVELAVEVRTRTIEAYREIMNMQL